MSLVNIIVKLSIIIKQQIGAQEQSTYFYMSIQQNGEHYVGNMLQNRRSMDDSRNNHRTKKQQKNKIPSNVQSNPNIHLEKIQLRYQSVGKDNRRRSKNLTTQNSQVVRQLTNKSPFGRKIQFKGHKDTINRMFTVQSENQRLIKRLKQINRRKNNYIKDTQPEYHDMKIYNQIQYRNKIRHLKQKIIIQENNQMVQRIMQKKTKTRNPLLFDDKQIKRNKSKNRDKKKSKSDYKKYNSRVLVLPPMDFHIN